MLGNLGEDPEADDALAEALQLDAVPVVAWEQFNGNGKDKSKGKGKEQRLQSVFRQETSCRGARGHWAGDDTCPRIAKNEGTLQSLARAYLTTGGETFGFDLALTGDEKSGCHTHARLVCHPLTASTDTSALEDVKNTIVEVRTQRPNVPLAWIADSSPPGARGDGRPSHVSSC